MSSAARAASPAKRHDPQRRRAQKPSLTRREALQLLAALLLVAGIPVVATVRILDANALRNERAHADAALQLQIQSATNELRVRADNASSLAEDVSRRPSLQRAFLTNDRPAIRRIARKYPRVAFYLHGKHVAGPVPKVAVTRSVSLALDGSQVGRVMATVPLDRALLSDLHNASSHAGGDKLLFVRSGAVLDSGQRVSIEGKTIRIGGTSYRGQFAPIPNSSGARLLGLRPTGRDRCGRRAVPAPRPHRCIGQLRSAAARRAALRQADRAHARRLPAHRLPGGDRLAHRARQPLDVRRGAGARVAPRRARRRPARADPRRHRRLQGDQRHPRPPGRRRGAARRRARALARTCARSTSRRATAARSSR